MKCDLCRHELAETITLLKSAVHHLRAGRFWEGTDDVEDAIDEIEGLMKQKGMV